MQIRRLFFVETGTYEDQMLRPYDTSLNQRTLIQLQEATRGGLNIAASSVAGIAGQIIAPTATPQGMATIQNGWQQSRMRFLMEVVDMDGYGGESVQYLSGYTNHVGVSLQSQALDPNMELFFNNSIQTKRVLYASPTGNVMQQRVTDAAHVLTGYYNPSYGNLHSATHSMRPQDVFSAVGASTLAGYGAELIDTRTAFAQGKLKKSVRANTSAPSYLARLLNTHNAEMATTEESDNLDEVMGRAAGAVQEPMLSTDLFLHEMMLRSRLTQGGYVTFGELMALQPGLDQMAEVFVANSAQAKAQNHWAGQTEHWGGATNETLAATILSHAVPGIMMDLMFTKISFHATNRNIGNQMTVALTGAKSFTEGLDLTRHLQSFVHRLQSEVLFDLSRGGALDFEIRGEFDVMGDTKISISMQGQPFIDYTTPSWGDALFAPVLTNDQFGLQKLATDVITLAENMQTDYSPMQTYGAPTHMETRNGPDFSL